MTVFLWFVLVACTLPYIAHTAVVVARFRRPEGYDAAQPRDQSADLDGWGARAWAAELNAFEALPLAISCGFIAHLTDADPAFGGLACALWVTARLAHLGAYLANVPPLRSLSFGVANLALGGLVVLSATA